MKCFFLLVILTVSTAGFPAQNLTVSTRIDLGIGANINKQAAFESAIVNPKLNAIQQTSDIIGQFIPERPKGREQAVLEVPSPIQQKDLIYDKAQQFVINFLHPKPIIDTISEEEKYGNNGDQFRSIGNAIVDGYEGFSNFLNSVVGLPFETMKQATRTASSYLATIGTKLVGL